MTCRSWVNGQPAGQIAVDDRGLQYGDGVFETMAVHAGRVRLLELHLQRLTESCRRLKIPPVPIEMLRQELSNAAAGEQQAILKLIVTRGSGGRGYRPPPAPQPNRILTLHPWPAYQARWWQEGIRMRSCATVLSRNPALAGLKHLNRLEQILARAEWAGTDDIQEGLMTDADRVVIEGTMSNVFVRLADGGLVTPALDECGVDGVMRRYVLERAAGAGLSIRTGKFTLEDLANASEMFVCNSVIGVWPVRQLDHLTFKVGEMTRKAQQWAQSA